ncbi:MAG: peptidylprolyl isomerase [Gammaproteobacteria bacterium]|nr:peptidylprolyl isomerase [Gammaproteobacteria bacterium]
MLKPKIGNHRKTSRPVLIAVGVALTLAGAGIGYAASQAEKGSGGSNLQQEIVARVGDRTITLAEFNRMVPRDPKNPAARVPPAKKKAFLEQLVNQLLFLEQAKALKLAERPEVAARIEDAVANVLMNEYVRLEIGQVPKPSEAQIKAYWKDNPEQFKVPTQVRARHILIATDKRDDAQARARAGEIGARLKAKESFETLAAELSDDSATKTRGGDLGLFAPGKMAPEFEKAAFALKAGETSAPVKTAFGYHLIKVEERREGFTRTYDSVREMISNKLQQDAQVERLEARVRELKAKTKTEVNIGIFDVED